MQLLMCDSNARNKVDLKATLMLFFSQSRNHTSIGMCVRDDGAFVLAKTISFFFFFIIYVMSL